MNTSLSVSVVESNSSIKQEEVYSQFAQYPQYTYSVNSRTNPVDLVTPSPTPEMAENEMDSVVVYDDEEEKMDIDEEEEPEVADRPLQQVANLSFQASYVEITASTATMPPQNNEIFIEFAKVENDNGTIRMFAKTKKRFNNYNDIKRLLSASNDIQITGDPYGRKMKLFTIQQKDNPSFEAFGIQENEQRQSRQQRTEQEVEDFCKQCFVNFNGRNAREMERDGANMFGKQWLWGKKLFLTQIQFAMEDMGKRLQEERAEHIRNTMTGDNMRSWIRQCDEYLMKEVRNLMNPANQQRAPQMWWSIFGGVGKTLFAEIFQVLHPELRVVVLPFNNEKLSNLVEAYYNEFIQGTIDVLIIDAARAIRTDKMKPLWKFLEQLNNGNMTKTKYEVVNMRNMKRPAVLIFSNQCLIDIVEYSADRFRNCYEIQAEYRISQYDENNNAIAWDCVRDEVVKTEPDNYIM